MNKDLILSYLKIEHLQENAALREIAEESGIEVVKLLLRNHEGLQVYVPKVTNLPALMEEFISASSQHLNERQLQSVTNVTRGTIAEYMRRIREKRRMELYNKNNM